MNALAQTTVTIGQLKYQLDGTEAYVSGYVGNPVNVVFPATIESDGLTFKVTKILTSAFEGCTSLSSIKSEGENLAEIRNFAFNHCTSLESILLPSIKTIGESAYSGCTSLVSVWVPGIRTIDRRAFSNCTSLESVWLGYNATSVKSGQYNYNNTVYTIKFDDGAFYNCTMLSCIVIPASCSVDDYSFSGCNRLQAIIYLGNQTGKCGSNADVYNIDNMITWNENSFAYSGSAPTPTFTNNLPMGFQAYTNAAQGNLEKNVGEYSTTVPITFYNTEQVFKVEIPFKYTITPITLTAQVKNASKVYGEANPKFESEYSGFITGEDASVITTQGTYSTSATTKSDVGSYGVTQSGAVAKNYVFNYKSGTLTVTKAPLTMTPRDKTMTYGDELPTFDVDYAGLKNSESKPVWISQPTITTSATKSSSAGTYPITISGGEPKNYTLTKKSGTLTINKATLTATTIDATREYGDNNPQFEVTYKGLKNGETAPAWVVSPTIVSPATKSSPVGEYTITATGGEAKNYTLQYQNSGKLTVTKAPLTAKARSYSRKQGEANPPFAIDYSGFKNGETKSVLIREPMASTTATRTSGIGTYPITVGGGEALNYEFIYVNGTLTIGEAEQLLTANTLNLQSLTVNKGTQAELKISLANENQITGLQFDLYLPQGVSVATNSKGKMLISTTERMDGSYSITGSDMGSYVRIVGYSADSDPFTGKSGDILTITLDVASTMADGNYNFQLRDIVLSDVYNTEFHPADVSATMTVKSYTLGDVDNSGAININDVVCIINHILNKANGVFIREAADVDGSGAININDVVTLINRFILKKSSAPRKAPRLVAMTDDNYMSLATIDIKPGETKEVAMLLNNQNEVKAVQGNLKLPAGLTFATKNNGRLDVKNNDSRSEDFTLSCALQDDGSMTFAHYSADGFAYDGNEGGIFTFKIKADENAAPGSYEVKLSEMVLSIEGVAYEEADRTCPLNITSTNGISEITIDDSSQVYTLDGLNVSGKPTKPGVYIRNGRKFVVK